MTPYEDPRNKIARITRVYETFAKDAKGRPVLGPDGTPRVEVMVEYTHPGLHHRQLTVRNVKELKPDPNADPDNEMAAITNALWEQVEAKVRAWRMGQEVPETGTRLAAWPGLGAEQADVLRANGILTLEAFCNATDSVLTRIPLPAIRALQQDCRIFMDSRHNAGIASNLAAKDEALKLANEEIELLKRAVLEMQAAMEESKPKRRKAVEAEAEAA